MKSLRIQLRGTTRALFGIRIPVQWTVDVPEGEEVPVNVSALKFEGTIRVAEKAAPADPQGDLGKI